MHTGCRRVDLAAAQQSGRAERFGLSRLQLRAGTVSCSATATSATTRISISPTNCGRATGSSRTKAGVGRGQGGTRRVADQRRKQRQHRRLVGAQGRTRRGQVARLRLSHHVARDGSEPHASRPHRRDVSGSRRAPSARSDPPLPPGATRFLIDFSGGDLSYYMSDPSMVETIATASAGRIVRTRSSRRILISAVSAPALSTWPRSSRARAPTCAVFLRAGAKALTETWTFPWRA